MPGSGRVPQWFTGQIGRLDPWGVLPAEVGELARPDHSADGIGAVAAAYGGLGEVQQFGALVPCYGFKIGQHLVQEGPRGR